MNANTSLAQRLSSAKASYTKTLAFAESLIRAGHKIINDTSATTLETYNGWKAWSKQALDSMQKMRDIPSAMPELIARHTSPDEEEEAINHLVTHCEEKQMEPKLVTLKTTRLRVLEKIALVRPFFELDEVELDEEPSASNGETVQAAAPAHPSAMDSQRTFNALMAPSPPTQSTQADPSREVASVEGNIPSSVALRTRCYEDALETARQPERVDALGMLNETSIQEHAANFSTNLGETMAADKDLGHSSNDLIRSRVVNDIRDQITQARRVRSTELQAADDSRECGRLREEIDRLRMLLISQEDSGQLSRRATPRTAQQENPSRAQFSYPPDGRSDRMDYPCGPIHESYESRLPSAGQYLSQSPQVAHTWGDNRNSLYQVNPTEAARMIPQFDGTREGYSNFIRIFDAMVGHNAPVHWKLFVLSTKLTKCTHALSKLDNPTLAYEETRRRLKELFGSTEDSLKLSAELQRANLDRFNPEQMRTDLVRIASIVDRMEQSEHGASRGDVFMFINKFPSDIARELTRFFRQGRNTSFRQVWEQANSIVEDLEITQDSSRRIPSNAYSPVPVMAMDETPMDDENIHALYSKKAFPPRKCLFCEKACSRFYCQTYYGYDYINRATTAGVCLKCYQRGHKGAQCPSRIVDCRICGATDHTEQGCQVRAEVIRSHQQQRRTGQPFRRGTGGHVSSNQ
uniref:CCHC-type domain-containing protein n=2 Tax=Caenorhabditis japonica TaxID=281687 RepID=A0A8R1DSA5_CAEJA